MAALNPVTRELVFKIVFYGPGLGGKTTTLQYIHAASKPEHRGNMVSLATDTDRTLYFDFVPLHVLKLRDLSVRLQLFTVPGQVYYAATRKLVLTGADGIVFVADSQVARLEANLESLDDLNANLREHGRKLSELPHTFQWNKRDLPDLVSCDELDRRLNLFSAPAVPTIATRGEGVFQGLEQITKLVFNAYKADLPKAGTRGPVFLDAEDVGLADAIRELADSQVPNRATGSGAKKTPASPAAGRELTPTIAPVSGAQLTLADLWPENDREGVRRCETLIGARDATSAVLACDALVTRVLAEASVLLGTTDQPRDPALLAVLIGIPGPRIVAFRSAVRAARQKKDVTVRDALEAYLFANDCRVALDRAAKQRMA